MMIIFNSDNKFGMITQNFQQNEVIQINQHFNRFSILNEDPNLITIQVNGVDFCISHQKILELQDIQINTIKFNQDCNIQITYSIA